MSHNHGDHCHDEHHDHDHVADTGGNADTLYQYIDQPNVRILNAVADKNILKPWNQRLDEEVFVESDADDQLIIRIPFTGSVKIRSILIKAGPGDQTPSNVAVFPNFDILDFDEISNSKPIQEFSIPQNRDVGEYAVKPAKFSNVSSVTLFFPASQGANTVRIYYIGFLGVFSHHTREAPKNIVYEAQANPADHPKVPGTGMFGTSSLGGGGGGAF
ncbi:hypothetical protein M422DRAFT_204047 [Sphaerobolus stellatus SS14]|nr:hypothetical protein M422DRAFT_204047 [Sphaerobolus stellatus SS14]